MSRRPPQAPAVAERGGTVEPGAADRRLGRLAPYAPPLVAWLVATTFMLALAAVEGYSPFSPGGTWERLDSGLYLSIARSGYSLYPCGTTGFGAGTACGNAGWFPAYPWLIGLLHLVWLSLAPTALAIAWLASLATLVVVWHEFLRERPRSFALLALAYAALAPGLVYDYAIFPLSLANLCAVLAFALAKRRRFLGAGLAAAVAALAYPLGLSVAAAGAALLVTRGEGALRERLRRLAAFALPSVGAIGVFVLDQRLETGHWNAYLLAQRKYDHAFADPFATVSGALGAVVHRSPVKLALGPLVHTIAPPLQTLLVALVLASVLVALLVRRRLTEVEALVALWAVIEWAFAHAVVNASSYRGEALLLPLAILLPRLPRALVAWFVVASLVLIVPMTRLFLNGVLD